MSTEQNLTEQYPDLPKNYLFPESDSDLIELIRNHSRLRIGGSNQYRYSSSRGAVTLGKDESGKLVHTEGAPAIQPVEGSIFLDKLNKIVTSVFMEWSSR